MLTPHDRALFNNLAQAPQHIKNAIQDAVNAARDSLKAAGFEVSYSDPHAALDAAVYRYMLESKPVNAAVDEEAPRIVEAATEAGTLDTDTDAPIVRPRHLLTSGQAYWLEPGPNVDYLMTAPRAADGGRVLWDDAGEVDEDQCEGYEEIVLALA